MIVSILVCYYISSYDPRIDPFRKKIGSSNHTKGVHFRSNPVDNVVLAMVGEPRLRIQKIFKQRARRNAKSTTQTHSEQVTQAGTSVSKQVSVSDRAREVLLIQANNRRREILIKVHTSTLQYDTSLTIISSACFL